MHLRPPLGLQHSKLAQSISVQPWMQEAAAHRHGPVQLFAQPQLLPKHAFLIGHACYAPLGMIQAALHAR